MSDFDTWTPLRAGERPPNWVDGMPWAVAPKPPGYSGQEPTWVPYTTYSVPLGAVHRAKPANYVAEEEIAALEEISVIARHAIGLKSLTGLREALRKIDEIADNILGGA